MQMIGIHAIELRRGVDPSRFERLMITCVLPNAAEVRGSINRGGVSAIKSQHLLKDQAAPAYLWLVKASGAMDFPTVFHRMYDDLHTTIDPLGRQQSSTVLSVPAAYDAGPRDVNGRPIGEPVRGHFI